jgi:hypothetical protein
MWTFYENMNTKKCLFWGQNNSSKLHSGATSASKRFIIKLEFLKYFSWLLLVDFLSINWLLICEWKKIDGLLALYF